MGSHCLHLQNTKKIAKGISQEMLDSVNRTQDTVQALLSRAEKDNSTIYLMKVRVTWYVCEMACV